MKKVTMKSAKFISCPAYIPKEYKNPWEDGFFNNKGVDIFPTDNVVSFIKTFRAEKEISSAVIRATAQGEYELYLNGERIGENGIYDELKPTNTDYNHHIFVYSYDITSLIKEENTIVAEVSQGWRSGRISFGYYEGRDIAFCGEIEITYADGSSEITATDETWLSTTDGPTRTADIWDGWYYDAQIKPLFVGSDDKKLVNSVIYNGNKAELTEPMCENVRIDYSLTRTPLTAVVHKGAKDNGTDFGEINIISKKAGAGCEKLTLRQGESVILDLGQNMVGRPLIEIKAKKGTVIKGYCAELLNDSGDESRGNDGPKGSMYIKNYRSALARVYYIAAGDETETVYPLHVFYGFRYFEITASDDVEILSMRGIVLKSDLKPTGNFSCSDAEVNKLFSNITWGARGNYLSIPTDCPQRDERLGWTGDTQIFATAGSYLMNTKLFFEKWLSDMRDSQDGHNGAYCCVCPRQFTGDGGNAAWADAGIIVPDVLYTMYNDTDILKEHFSSMCEYMDYIQKTNGLDGPNTAYGDWLNYEVTDKRYIAVCYYALDASLMVKFCGILMNSDPGKRDFYAEKSEYFSKLLGDIKAHFLKKYFSDGDLNPDMRTQTTYLLALGFGLIPEEHFDACRERLAKKISGNNYTLSTGFVGTGVLAKTLQQLGLYDLAYDLLLQTDDPSWLYSVRQGATTVWERWNSYTLKTGFGDVGMNSFNHYAYGAVAAWMFDGICGIRPDPEKPGFKEFYLCPTPDRRTFIPEGQKKITYAYASYESAAGEIKSGWDTQNGRFVYYFTIPAGAKAKVGLLDKEDSPVFINDLEFSKAELAAETKGDRTYFTLTEGEYTVC